MFNQNLDLNAELGATVIRGDGSHREIANLSSGSLDWKAAEKKLKEPLSFWKRLWVDLRNTNAIPLTLGVGALIHSFHTGDLTAPQLALVTTAGVNYLAADFISGGSAHIAAFNWQDCGTGTNPAVIADTTLQTPAGTSRVSGTQSTPSSGQYRSVATIPFTGTLAITEFGLFSAASTGTLWDHRVFSVINVANGDSIQFTYTVTVTAGGS
jgi:hypothetical protein